MNTIHPRPNPIVAAMYTLRDLDVDVIIVHGPAGCGFMASRMLEEAGIRVVTSALVENDLVFGGSEKLIRTIKESYDRFHPKTIAVIGQQIRQCTHCSGFCCTLLTTDQNPTYRRVHRVQQ